MFSIEYSPSASNTPAYALIVEGWNHLVQEGFTLEDDALPPLSPESRVLFAVSDKDGDIIGVATWTAQKTVATVGLVYVEPSSVNAGVFKALMEALSKRLRNEKIGHVRLTVHAQNKGAQAAMRHLGQQPQALVYDVRL